MMKYKSSGWIMMTVIMKKPLKKRLGAETTAVIKSAKPIYKDMLEKTEDIGEKNPMAGNIYMGFVCMAVWKALDGKMPLDEYRKVIEEMMLSPFVVKLMSQKDINKAKDMAAVKKQFEGMADWCRKNPEYGDKSWDFNFDESKHKDGFYFYYTRCPMEKFARENGYMDILPACCDIDYLTVKYYHANLVRNETLASGGTMCDYWCVPDKISDPQ